MLLGVSYSLLLFILTCYGYPSLLFTTVKDVRIANITRPNKTPPIVKDLENGAGVDYYLAGNLICWGDHDLEVIQCTSYNGSQVSSNKTTVVSNDIMFPEGLACDWLTQKLYWTDAHKNRLEVVSLDGKHRKILFWQDLDQPRAIALVPTESIMFWTDWGEVPKIERASMDGDLRTRKVIVSERIFWPNGLTVDFDNRKLYWVDGKLKFIEVMDYDGKNRKLVLDKVVDYPYALTMFKDKLYWTDWNLLSVFTLDRVTMEHRELIHYEDATPIDIRVIDSSRQPYKHTPCANNNGGCSHLCLLSTVSPAGYTCACPTGVKLIDNSTCANGPQQMLLLAQMLEIDTISLDSPDHTCVQVPVKGIKHAIDLSYDPVNKFIYWSDEEAQLISRAHLDGSNQEVVINTDLDHPDGLAVDWRAENLYWIDAGTDRIQVLRINTTYTKVLVNTDLVNPRSIAVSPDEGLMFWSDWNERSPKVERAALDGSGRTILVKDGLGWPNGIALDIPRRRLYWCDAKTERIEMISYEGRERREVVTDNLPHVFGLTLLGDYLYWTDWQRRSIESAHKITGTNRRVILDQQANMMGLKAVGPVQKSSHVNPCSINNGNCAHLCLNTPSKPVCTCQMGYEIDSNMRSCVVPKAFLLFARKENIGRISIENAQNDAIIPASGIKDASSLNFDISDNRIYWTDVKAKAITRAFINGSHVEKVIEFGLESPEGLAVDWLANNMYWTDTGTRRIEVSRLNGWYRKAIIWTDLVEPRSIAVHPSEGYIYWSDWGGEGSLNRSRLDGSQAKGLVWSVGRVSSLSLDLVAQRIYWCAIQGFIESASLDGTRRQTVATSPRPFTLTLYQNKIYWSDWQKCELYSANKVDGSNQVLVHSKLEQVTSIVVYHDWGQANKTKPACYPPCPGLCLGRCSCPTHYSLASNRTCRPPQSFALVSTKSTVSRLLLNTSDCPDAPLPIHGLKNIKAMDYDPVHHMLYWIDGGRSQSIKRWRMSAGGRGRGVPLPAGPERAASIAIEPRYRLLYWSSSSEGTINATRLDNGTTPVLVVRSHHSEKPKDIAIHSPEGLLFWLSVGRDTRIYRSRLDGGSRTTLVSSLVTPVTSLAVDTPSSTLYWMTLNSIESIDFNGKSRREVVRDNLSKVGNLAIFSGTLLWVHGSRLVSHNLATGRNRIAFSSHYPITALAAVVQSHPRSDTWTCIGGERVDSPLECPDTGGLGYCDSDQFTCTGTEGECIPMDWRCDGIIDCLNSADEANCPPCPEGKFTCAQGQCIEMRWVCDGTPNCLDHSDEKDCCAGHECGGHCIPPEVVCDGWQNCADGSDEAPAACAKHRPDTISSKSINYSSNYLILGVLLVFILLAGMFFYYKCPSSGGKCCRKKPVDCVMDPALDPLSPNGYASRGVGLGSSLRMSTLGGTSSSGANTLCYPANPPPSPATTQRCMLYRPPPPTPCSTDQAHDTDSNYHGDLMEPLPPPPTPTSLSPSSSTYFHPVPPPPPSPTP